MMFKMKTNLFIFSVIAAILLASPVDAQEYSRSRSLREAFKVPPSAEIQVINKYGDVHLVPWAKDSVVYEIEFSVTSSKQSRVDKMYDYVDFDFKATNYYIIAQTVFQGQNSLLTGVADAASTLFSGGTSTRIDYTVYFPEKSDVRIENKFGNIYTTDHLGKADFTLSNGDLKAHSFHGRTRLKIDFGNASIDSIQEGTILLNYTEMNLEQAGFLDLETKSSKLYLDMSKELKINSRRDRYYIKTAGVVSGSSYFSFLSFDELAGRINLSATYGDLILSKFKAGFGQAEINTQYTDVTVYLDPDQLVEFDITRDDKVEMVYSSGIRDKQETLTDEENKIYQISCSAGKPLEGSFKMVIRARAGKIFFSGI